MLTLHQIIGRARAIKLVVSDWSGVLVDPQEQFSLRDGQAVERLRSAAIRTAILSADRSTRIARRAEALGSLHLFLGVRDKTAQLEMIADDAGLTLDDVAFIGADPGDATLMRTIADRGLVGAPSDSPEEVAAIAHHRCKTSAGFGALREFADWILEHRGAQG